MDIPRRSFLSISAAAVPALAGATAAKAARDSQTPPGIRDTVLEAIVERNQFILDSSRTPRKLGDQKSSDKYKVNRLIASQELKNRKGRLATYGFAYSSGSSSVSIDAWEDLGSTATAKVTETTGLDVLSYLKGPENVTTKCKAHHAALFVRQGSDWVIDELILDGEQHGLPMSVVEISSTPTRQLHRRLPATGRGGATPGPNGVVTDP